MWTERLPSKDRHQLSAFSCQFILAPDVDGFGQVRQVAVCQNEELTYA